DKSLDEEDGSVPRSEIKDSQLKVIIEEDPHNTIQEVAQELNVDHSTVVRHLFLLKNQKSSTNRYLTT
ncbi:hypothetical protein NPIL_47851, partial [Nephila pilipes]